MLHATRAQQQKRREVVHARHIEVIASCSELLSLHCPRHPLLLALLPALAGAQVIMRQDCSAYAEEPLRTAGLLEAAHRYSLQDICRSTCTPILTLLPTQERQLNNLNMASAEKLAFEDALANPHKRLPICKVCWAEAPIKIARMTLTIKLDGNWSSFQLANSAPPLSVTDSAIAPSARMPQTII